MARPLVLIVEDELIIALDIKEILEEEGYEARINITSVDDAITAIRESKPALVLIDINLKQAKDGIDLGTFAGSFSASKLANHLGLTQKALTAAIFRVTGDGISALAMQVRLEIAHELLTSTNLPIETVRECAGIRSKAYFSDMFKDKFGMTPREFCLQNR